MRTHLIKTSAMLGMFLILATCIFGQATQDNNVGVGGNFLGFDGSGLSLPLEIRNDFTEPIEFHTDGTKWVELTDDGRWLHNIAAPGNATFRLNAVSGTGTAMRINLSNPTTANVGYWSVVNGANNENVGAYTQVVDDDAGNSNNGSVLEVEGEVPRNYGVRALVENASDDIEDSANYGVLGTASSDDGVFTDYAYGVRGEACGARINMGVYGTTNPAFSSNCHIYPSQVFYAGYFAGTVVTMGAEINPSDENLKTNVQNLTNASALLNQLEVKTYEFDLSTYDYMGLPETPRYGLISQDVEAVLPDLVHDAVFPAQQSEDGTELSPEVAFKGIEYDQFIPLLIAAFNEQDSVVAAQAQQNNALQDEITALESQLAEIQGEMNEMMSSFQQLQSSMNTCCGTAPSGKSNSETGKNELEQNFPNPFETETTINFTIYEPARIRLEISDAQGRVLEVLVNGRLSEGRYTERWDASAYAPGTYFYSLYADTELLTNKMISK
jgi:hypothetical protein